MVPMVRLELSPVALALMSCMVGDEGRYPDDDADGVVDMSSALLVSTRDHLDICVQVDPLIADRAGELVGRVQVDVTHLAEAHPDWAAAGLDHGAISVVAGCPGAATIDAPIDAKGTAGVVLGPGFTTEPSPFRLHVHVIADARATAVLGDALYARALAELAPLDEHRVAEVSTALVVPVSALGTEAFRMRALAESLGLPAR